MIFPFHQTNFPWRQQNKTFFNLGFPSSWLSSPRRRKIINNFSPYRALLRLLCAKQHDKAREMMELLKVQIEFTASLSRGSCYVRRASSEIDCLVFHLCSLFTISIFVKMMFSEKIRWRCFHCKFEEIPGNVTSQGCRV